MYVDRPAIFTEENGLFSKKNMLFFKPLLLVMSFLVIVIGLTTTNITPKVQWLNNNLHSGLELIIALAALTLAIFLMARYFIEHSPTRELLPVAAGLFGMGALGIAYIGLEETHDASYYLHVMAALCGGIGFSSIWLIHLQRNIIKSKQLIIASITLIIMVGLVSFIFSDISNFILQTLIDQVALISAIGFFGGAAYFFQYHQEDNGHFLLGCYALLMGTANLFLNENRHNLLDWWIWHIIQVVSAGLAPLYVYQWVHQLDQTGERYRKRLHLIDELVPVGLFYLNAQGECEYANNKYLKISGLQNTKGRNWLNSVYIEDRAKVIAYWAHCIQQSHVGSLEYRFQTPDNAISWVLCQILPETDSNGNVIGFVGSCTDISTAKQNEQELELRVTERTRALRESEERFAGILQTARDAIIAVDDKQRIVLFNQGAEQIFGFSMQEILDQPLEKLMPERYADVHHSHVDLFANAANRSSENMNERRKIFGRRKNGEEFPAEGTISKLHLRGKILFTVILRDMSIYYEIENARVENYKRYRGLFENSPIALIEDDFSDIKDYLEDLKEKYPDQFQQKFEENIVDLVNHLTQLRVIDTNQAALKLFGADNKEILHHSLSNLFIEETLETLCKVILALNKGEEQLSTETAIETLQGCKRYCVMKVSVMPSYEKDWGHIIISLLDITERRQAELNLVEAKSKAEAANKAKSEFLANVSHEVRTPLNSILGFAQILERDQGLTPVQLERVKTILASGNHLLLLVNDIIEMAKLEAHQTKLHIRMFHLVSFLKNLLEMFTLQTQQAGLRFIYHLPANLFNFVHADETRLRQILINIMGNAIKFTPAGGQVSFQIETIGTKTRFIIEDTGAGISPDLQAIIFQPFNKGLHRLKPGNGLGLTISQRFLKMMNSELHLESKVGVGSRFWFDLELVEEKSLIKDTLRTIELPRNITVEAPISTFEKIIMPSPTVLNLLQEMARSGDVGGLEEQLIDLEKNPLYETFAEKLKTLAEQFQIQQIRDLLNSYCQMDKQ